MYVKVELYVIYVDPHVVFFVNRRYSKMSSGCAILPLYIKEKYVSVVNPLWLQNNSDLKEKNRSLSNANKNLEDAQNQQVDILTKRIQKLEEKNKIYSDDKKETEKQKIETLMEPEKNDEIIYQRSLDFDIMPNRIGSSYLERRDTVGPFETNEINRQRAQEKANYLADHLAVSMKKDK